MSKVWQIIDILRNKFIKYYKNTPKNGKKSQYTNSCIGCYNIYVKEGHPMATVFDVARYVLNKQGSMTAMKLEKLVYYSQAWSLAWDEVPLFDNEFQAWANGPVCPELFSSHRGYYVIPSNFYDDDGNPSNLTSNEKETIDAVLSYYGDKEPQWLSDLTHKERPWREAREGVPIGERSDNIVKKETMQEYYGGLR